MNVRVEFGVLGPVEVRHEGRTLPTGSARERYVLAALLLDADRLVSTDRLVDALWRTPPTSAKAQLHNMISKIRGRFRGFDDELIATRPAGYQLRLDGHRLDLVEFRERLAAARCAAERGEHHGTVAILDGASGLWRGPALADVPDDIAADARQALGEERLAAGELRLDAQLALGEYAGMLAELNGLLAEHPYREHLYRRQMLALAGAGRRADALAAYRRAYRRLVDDLGVEPGGALRELEQQILRGLTPSAASPPQLVPRQLPPVNGPVTGRDELLHEVTGCLTSRGDAALPVVVLVGPGGVGKTTLALSAGHRLAAEFPGGQLYADLRGSHGRPADPYQVTGRFLRALGVPGTAVPEDPEERLAMYRSHLADGALVVLDDAADEAQVRPLLPGSPRCAVAVTSRRQLAGLLGATRFAVPQLVDHAAVALLGRIAGPERVAAEPEAAARIARSCGALPLAVSIAGARLAAEPGLRLERFAVSLAEERGRLDQLTVGDLDVRASIALSYQQLPAPAARLFGQLGALPTADWPEWLPDALGGGDPAVLGQLVDVHLVEPLGVDPVGQQRYRFHDLVAAYAAEQAPQDADPDVWRLVLDGWLGLVTLADEAAGASTAPLLDAVHPPAPASAADAVRRAPLDWFETERVSLQDAVELAGRLAG
ncbi:MAG: BTAD domain-containing putative transcriptional regulator, partial [Micromonosporaceae bacterium]